MYILILLILIISLTGCNSNAANKDENNDYQVFEAEVIESDGTLLVTPDKDTVEYSSSDKISVAVNEAEFIDNEGNALDINILKPGDRIKITYDGIIAESYPAQITASRIELISPTNEERNSPPYDESMKKLDELEGVWIETEYESYETGITDVRVKWYNSLKDDLMFGEFFTLEKKVNGSWENVSKETDINYGFDLIGYVLVSNDTRWHTYHLIPYTDGLSSGEYRISASFTRTSLDGKDYGAGKYPDYQAYGHFMVGDNMIKRDMSVLD